MRSAVFALLGLMGVALVAACSDATGHTAGGTDIFDASPAPSLPPPDASTAADSGSGITFTDLYRDFFGPTAVSSCKGSPGNCHGAVADQGGTTWVCGDTQASCYAGMTAPAAALVDTKNPSTSLLLGGLRSSKGGNMPLSPSSYTFSDASIKRISDWMAAGAQNN